MKTGKRKVKIMVASSVYGNQNDLSQIVAELNTMGFEVLNSHYGSVKVISNLSNLDNCLDAVEECDLFLGIIYPHSGTGIIGEKNIFFEEVKTAIKLKKPYWFLVHRDVTFARNLFKKIKLGSRDEIVVEKNHFFDKTSIEIYEYAIQNHIPVERRKGNWAQEFFRINEMMVYVKNQFSEENMNRVFTQTM